MQRTKNCLHLETFFLLSLKEIIKGVPLRTSFKNSRPPFAQLAPNLMGTESLSLSSFSEGTNVHSLKSSPGFPNIRAGKFTLGQRKVCR